MIVNKTTCQQLILISGCHCQQNNSSYSLVVMIVSKNNTAHTPQQLSQSTKRHSSYSLAVMIANKTTQIILVNSDESQQFNIAHTHTEFILAAKRWKARWELYSTDQNNPSNLCETLVLVNKNLYPNIYFILTATAERSFSLFETCKDISTLHNGTEKTIRLGNATGIYTDTFSFHWMQWQTSVIKTQTNDFGL